MEYSNSVRYANLLKCDENMANLEDEEVEIEECDNEYIQTLLDSETRSGRHQFQKFVLASWIGRARLDAIHYILRTRERLGFRVHTAYLSVTYFDRFILERSIDVEKTWAVRLLAMACLSLAAKMEECTVHSLSEFCSEDYSFESTVIQRMELLVLGTLEWKMGSVSPFAFINFFAKKFFDDSPRNGVARAVEIILGSMGDVKIMFHRPSVLAAAATLVALDAALNKDVLQQKLGPLSSSGSFEIEDIISCYYQVQELDMGGLKLGKDIISRDLSPIQLQGAEPNGSSSITSASSGKRKRLVFENDGVPEKNGKP